MEPGSSGDPGDYLRGFLGDLLKLLHTDSPLQWQLAVQLANSVASEGDTEPNPDPKERIRLQELARIVELHVADVTGMAPAPTGSVEFLAVGRAEWARRTLEDWRPVLEGVAAALSPQPGAVEPATSEEDGFAALFGQWASAVAPAMIAMQVGSVVGHLAQRSLGPYDLPVPRKAGGQIALVPRNIADVATDWSLSLDDMRLYALVQSLTEHTVLSRPHVHDTLSGLLVAHAARFRPDPHALEAHLGSIDPGDMTALTRLLGDPAAFGQPIETPELIAVRNRLSALTSAIVGYSEWASETIVRRLVGAPQPLLEAVRRRRIERGEGERVAEDLLGLRLGQDQVERGESFVRGIVERGGEAELAKLWVVESNLPTMAEVDAPGLWIARVNLPGEAEPPEA